MPLFTGDTMRLQDDERYAWVAPLDEAERLVMRDEVTHALTTALRTGDWSEYQDAWYDWRATAETLNDPELVSSLLAGRTPEEEVPLRRP